MQRDEFALLLYMNVRFNRLEQMMSDLSDALGLEEAAIQALSDRIDQITGPLQTALDAANAALADAQAADVADKAALDAANAQVADALATVQTQVNELNNLAQPAAPPA